MKALWLTIIHLLILKSIVSPGLHGSEVCGPEPTKVFLRKGERTSIVFWSDQPLPDQNQPDPIPNDGQNKAQEEVDSFLEAVNSGTPINQESKNDVEIGPQFAGFQQNEENELNDSQNETNEDAKETTSTVESPTTTTTIRQDVTTNEVTVETDIFTETTTENTFETTARDADHEQVSTTAKLGNDISDVSESQAITAMENLQVSEDQIKTTSHSPETTEAIEIVIPGQFQEEEEPEILIASVVPPVSPQTFETTSDALATESTTNLEQDSTTFISSTEKQGSIVSVESINESEKTTISPPTIDNAQSTQSLSRSEDGLVDGFIGHNKEVDDKIKLRNKHKFDPLNPRQSLQTYLSTLERNVFENNEGLMMQGVTDAANNGDNSNKKAKPMSSNKKDEQIIFDETTTGAPAGVESLFQESNPSPAAPEIQAVVSEMESSESETDYYEEDNDDDGDEGPRDTEMVFQQPGLENTKPSAAAQSGIKPSFNNQLSKRKLSRKEDEDVFVQSVQSILIDEGFNSNDATSQVDLNQSATENTEPAFPVGDILDGIYKLVESYISPTEATTPEQETTPPAMQFNSNLDFSPPRNVHNTPREEIFDQENSKLDPFVELPAPNLQKPQHEIEENHHEDIFPVPIRRDQQKVIPPYDSPALRVQEPPVLTKKNGNEERTAGPLPLSAPVLPEDHSDKKSELFLPGEFLRGGASIRKHAYKTSGSHPVLPLNGPISIGEPVSVPIPALNRAKKMLNFQRSLHFDPLSSLRNGDAKFQKFLSEQSADFQEAFMPRLKREAEEEPQLSTDDRVHEKISTENPQSISSSSSIPFDANETVPVQELTTSSLASEQTNSITTVLNEEMTTTSQIEITESTLPSNSEQLMTTEKFIVESDQTEATTKNQEATEDSIISITLLETETTTPLPEDDDVATDVSTTTSDESSTDTIKTTTEQESENPTTFTTEKEAPKESTTLDGTKSTTSQSVGDFTIANSDDNSPEMSDTSIPSTTTQANDDPTETSTLQTTEEIPSSTLTEAKTTTVKSVEDITNISEEETASLTSTLLDEILFDDDYSDEYSFEQVSITTQKSIPTETSQRPGAAEELEELTTQQILSSTNSENIESEATEETTTSSNEESSTVSLMSTTTSDENEDSTIAVIPVTTSENEIKQTTTDESVITQTTVLDQTDSTSNVTPFSEKEIEGTSENTIIDVTAQSTEKIKESTTKTDDSFTNPITVLDQTASVTTTADESLEAFDSSENPLGDTSSQSTDDVTGITTETISTSSTSTDSDTTILSQTESQSTTIDGTSNTEPEFEDASESTVTELSFQTTDGLFIRTTETSSTLLNTDLPNNFAPTGSETVLPRETTITTSTIRLDLESTTAITSGSTTRETSSDLSNEPITSTLASEAVTDTTTDDNSATEKEATSQDSTEAADVVTTELLVTSSANTVTNPSGQESDVTMTTEYSSSVDPETASSFEPPQSTEYFSTVSTVSIEDNLTTKENEVTTEELINTEEDTTKDALGEDATEMTTTEDLSSITESIRITTTENISKEESTITPSITFERKELNCSWHISTEENLYLLMTFYNLSAPFTVDCQGAYIEVEREFNGFEARWCGNKMTTGGSRPHVVFARQDVRITIYDDGAENKDLPTGFSADVEVIDLYDGGQNSKWSQSSAYSNVRKLNG